MNKITLEDKQMSIWIDENRFIPSGIYLNWTCPNCGEIHTQEMNRDSYHFTSIEANKEKVFTVACVNCDENYEFKGELEVRFNITDCELKEKLWQI